MVLNFQVLQIIPESMFTLLHQIIEILTNQMKEVPTRLDKEKMKEFSQLDARYSVRRGWGGLCIGERGREGGGGNRENGRMSGFTLTPFLG